MGGCKSVIAPGVVGVMLILGGCNGTQTSQGAGSTFLKACAGDELQSNAVLYFGPSNQIGPGSIWTRLGPNGGYQPQWRTEDLDLNYAKIVQVGKGFPCHSSTSSTLTAGGGVSALSPAANVSAEVKADFERAKSMTVSASEAAWDSVMAGPYFLEIEGISDDRIRKDVRSKNRLVVRRALRLSGYKALLDFGTNFTPELKAKYDGVKLGAKTVGEVGAQFTAKWTNDQKLELSAADNVYVAGEFAEMGDREFVSTREGKDTIQDLGDKWVKPYIRPGQ